MGGDGVSDISVGAGEGFGGMVNGAGLTSEFIARSGVSGGWQYCGGRAEIFIFSSFHLYRY